MATHPDTPAQAAALIERFEGVESQAYLDPVGIPTICAGLTRYPSGAAVQLGDVCDLRVCRAHLELLLARDYIPVLAQIPGWGQLGATRQAVLLSFAWNLGARFYGRPGFETISRVLREGAQRPEVYRQMRQALALYVQGDGRTLPGLVARRQQEADLWDRDEDGPMHFQARQDTWLKRAPIASSWLSEQGKRAAPAGTRLQVSRLEEIAADSHGWITLEECGERWAIFLPHWGQGHPTPTPTPAPAPAAVNWGDFGARLGQYLTVGEVLQYDSRRKPRAGSSEERELLRLAREFDAIRRAWQGPIGVTSGYRPEPINRQVGGVPGSYHVKGMALDIYPIGESLEKFHRWLLPRWSGGYGDGRAKGFIHLDTRQGGQFHPRAGVKPAAVWNY
jgi:GH24 family phage-related lysozyme (muramidase)